MAKRKSNKSQAIRDYLTKDPDASAQTIAKALKVTPALVYNVKSNMNAKKGTGKRSKRKRRAGSSATDNGSVDHVITAAKLIQSCGGIPEARQALKAAEHVAAALED